jgi:hypothetical protein
MWVVTLAGLCFLLGGLGVVLPAAVTGEVTNDGTLPAGTPFWLRVVQFILVLMIFTCFAMIGSFVAFGPGTRSFSVSLPFGSTSGGSEIFGRVAFGVGAIITWLCLILVAVNGWRKHSRTANLPPGHARGAVPSSVAVVLKTAQKRVALGPRREGA